MYVPKHLEYLDRSGTVDGWPKGVTAEAKQWATDKVKAGLAKYGRLDLDLARLCIFERGHVHNEVVPECLRGCMWDWLYAITHRALLAADARTVWVAK
jgi:hypothetical protein